MSYREIRVLDAMSESPDPFVRGIASLYSVANHAQRILVREEWDMHERISDEIETFMEPHP